MNENLLKQMQVLVNNNIESANITTYCIHCGKEQLIKVYPKDMIRFLIRHKTGELITDISIFIS